MMIKKFTLLVLLILPAIASEAQQGVSIAANSVLPDSSAMLDIKSTSKGALLPRLSTSQMNAIAGPAVGLAVYNTDSASFCIYTGAAWVRMITSLSQTAGPWTTSGSNIYKNNSGNVGIGTTAPKSLLHVSNGNALVTGTYGSGAAIEASGSGTRMFFDPKQAAFRAGYAVGSTWDSTNVGDYSFAAGYNAKASGQVSTAFGSHATASGGGSLAVGTLAGASGSDAVAIGSAATASGTEAVSLGSSNVASGANAASLGALNQATGNQSTAIGNSNAASGTGATAVGNNVTAKSGYEFVAGRYNTDYTPNSTTGFNPGDRLFTVGNGSSSTTRSNALTILKNGNTGIGTETPAQALDVNGATRTTSLQMTNGATDGYVLQSDASGNGTWVAPATYTQDTLSLIRDADNDTKVATDLSDDDQVHFTLGGVEYFTMSKGTLGTSNTGNGVFLGNNAGAADDYANRRNVAIGTSALAANVTGANNTAVGYQSLFANTANSNTGLGYRTLWLNTTGAENTATGTTAMGSNTTGTNNTATGASALSLNTTGSYNTAFGSQALSANTAGSHNTAIGMSAGANIAGDDNVLIGYSAGYDETGSNKLYIANSSTNTPLLYGDFSNKSLTVNDSLRARYLRMTNGAASGYVLQSDASGNGAWVNPSDLATDTLSIIADADGNTKVHTDLSGDDKIHFTLGGTEYFTMNKGTLEWNNTGGSLYLGNAAGFSDPLSTANYNIGLGSNALQAVNESSYNNTGIGRRVLQNLTGLAHNNTAMGSDVLRYSASGIRNTALGAGALYSDTSGSSNVAVGFTAGYYNTGSGSVFLGNSAGSNETGSNKLYIANTGTTTPLLYGDFSNKALTVNDSLRAKYLRMTNGATAGYVLQSDASGNGAWVSPSTLSAGAVKYVGNSYLGQTSGAGATGSSEGTSANRAMIAIGDSAANANTTGSRNIALGRNALATNTANNDLIAIGDSALQNAGVFSGTDYYGYNTSAIAIGTGALANIQYPGRNIAIGYQALMNSLSDFANTAIGYQSQKNTEFTGTASNNTSVGSESLVANTIGTSNTAIGSGALYQNTSGSGNVALGYIAGQGNTGGTNNTFLGYNAIPTGGGLQNATAIGAYAKVATSNSLVLGGTGTFAVNVGIGTQSPTQTLEVAGTTKTTSLQVTNGAAANYLLQSDASGNAAWASPTNGLSASAAGPVLGGALTAATTVNASAYPLTIGGALGSNATDQSQANDNQFNNNQTVSQTFTTGSGIGSNAYLTAIKIQARGDAGGNAATLSIYDASSALLSSQAITVATSGYTSGSPQTFTLSTPIAVTAGTQYKFTIALASAPTSNYRLFYQTGNPYSGGQASFNSSYDLHFTTYIASYGTLAYFDGANSHLGIGTASPTTALDVAGTTRTTDFQMTDGATTGYVLKSDASGNGTWVSPSSLTASNALSLSGSTITSTVNGTAATLNISAAVTASETDPQVSSTVTNMVPKWNGSTLADGTIYDNGSNVGIGTTSPSSQLHVYKASGNVGILAHSAAGGAAYASVSAASGQEAGILFATSSGTTSTSQRWVLGKSTGTESGSNAGSDLFLNRYTDAGAYLGQPLVVTRSTGYVGINQGAPAAQLDVNGTTKTSGLQMTSGAANGYILKSDASGNAAWVSPATVETDPQVSSTTTGYVPKWNGTTLTDGTIYDNGTNVAIGTTSLGSQSTLTLGAMTATSATAGARLQLNGGGSYYAFALDNTNNLLRFMSGPSNTSNSFSTLMSLGYGGAVGIHVTSATKAMLQVEGYAFTSLNSNYGYLNSSGNTGTGSGSVDNNYSIYASERVAASEFNAHSDARIKHIIGRSNAAQDLATLMQLHITNYHFVDTVAKGSRVIKKVIAQEVETVYPQAVSRMTNEVPDIYQLASITDGCIALKTELKAGDTVKLIFGERSELVRVEEADGQSFRVALKDEGSVFVYGRQVNDFRTVDYEALSMLNVSATQALVRQVQALQEENKTLRTAQEATTQRLNRMNNDLEAVKAMLEQGRGSDSRPEPKTLAEAQGR